MIPQRTGRHAAFAPGSTRPAPERESLRQEGARPGATLLRLFLAPFALAAAALSGILFVVLLPICGIGSIAEGIARASWRYVRRAVAACDRR